MARTLNEFNMLYGAKGEVKSDAWFEYFDNSLYKTSSTKRCSDRMTQSRPTCNTSKLYKRLASTSTQFKSNFILNANKFHSFDTKLETFKIMTHRHGVGLTPCMLTCANSMQIFTLIQLLPYVL